MTPPCITDGFAYSEPCSLFSVIEFFKPRIVVILVEAHIPVVFRAARWLLRLTGLLLIEKRLLYSALLRRVTVLLRVAVLRRISVVLRARLLLIHAALLLIHVLSAVALRGILLHGLLCVSGLLRRRGGRGFIKARRNNSNLHFVL